MLRAEDVVDKLIVELDKLYKKDGTQFLFKAIMTLRDMGEEMEKI